MAHPPGYEQIMKHLNDSSGWVPMEVDAAKCPGVQAWKKAVEGTSVEMIKATGLVPGADAAALCDRIFSQTYAEKAKEDPSFIAEEVLLEEGPSKVMYQVYSAPWPVSNRDLVFRRTKVVENGVHMQIDFSETHPSKPDPVASNVRAHLMSVYRYEPAEGGCIATWMVLMDPRGSVPAFVVNASSSKVPTRISGMKKLLQ